jgi:ubiquinone/menaquinone biosynthesis C-methylase UbiE
MNSSNPFDAKAAGWDDNPRRLAMARVFSGHLVRHGALTRETECLEFGCGTGLVGTALSGRVRSIVMLDTSRGMIRELEKKIQAGGPDNLEPLCADIENLDPERFRFDLVYAFMALHHVSDISSCLATFYRLLKPGGRLCLGDLEPEDGSFHGDLSGVHYGFDPGALKGELENLGLEVLCVKRMHTVMKPAPDGTPKKFPLFFLAARREAGEPCH